MASGICAMARCLTVAAVLPLALCGAPAAADPGTLPVGGFASGSSSGSDGGASGSGIASSGSATGSSGPEDTSQARELRLGPIVVPTPFQAPLRVDTVAVPPVPPVRAVAVQPDADASLAHMLGLSTGSVVTACAGSAVAGGAGILLGLLTGSGLIGPGTVGVGSSGSSLGSVAVGSALTGSAVLTCLLLLPGIPPPAPELPLQIPAPPPPIPPVLPVRAPAPPPPPPEIAPAPPRVMPPPEPIAESEPPPAPVAWNVLELITVLLVSVIAAVRTRSSDGGQRAGS